MTDKPADKQRSQGNPSTEHKCRQATVVSAYYQGEARIQIASPPAEVYALVADVTRMGEWSPECYRCEWLGGATGPQAGASFRGHNQWGEMRWARTATITVAAPGEEFAFTTISEPEFPDSTDWCYRFEARQGGTLVTESCVVTENQWAPEMHAMIEEHGRGTQQRMQQTLERLKAAAEARMS
jgi:hypothetical protein